MKNKRKSTKEQIDFIKNDLSTEVKLWLDAFDVETREKLEKRIYEKKDDSKQLEDIENEISVGYLLIKSGFSIIYENKIDGKTPDWYVSENNTHPAFIVEVRTLNSMGAIERFHKEFIELKNEIKHLNYKVELELEYSHLVDEKMTTCFFDRDNIILEIDKWLFNMPQVDDIFEINDMKFRVVNYNCSNGVILKKSVGLGHKLNDYRFISALKEKHSTYRNLVVKNKIPYVIVIFNTIESGTNPRRMENLFSRGIISGRNFPEVSGVMIIEHLPNWTVHYLHNPYQLFTLEENIFETMQEFHNVPIDKIDDFIEGR